LVLIISILSLEPSRSAPPKLPDAAQATPKTSLQALRKSARTPEERVALTDAWIKAHPATTHPAPASSAGKSAPARQLTGKAALQEEISRNLHEMRAESPDPKEQVRRVDEFLRLNKDAIESLKPFPAANPAAAQQAYAARIQARLAAHPDDVSAQMADALLDIRTHAKNPQERVRLVAELLRLNRDLIQETQRVKPKKPIH
jgi:cyanate lyase